MTNYAQYTHGRKGIFDVALADMFPAESVELQCLSFVDAMLTAQFQDFSERIVLACNVDNLPEEILDILAVQYRIPYYDSDLTMQQKRDLVREGYRWVMTAGTTGCINRLVRAIFGNGNTVEWYEDKYGNISEGYFDIQIDGEYIPKDKVATFERILRKAKNVHSKLRYVISKQEIYPSVNIVGMTMVTDKIIIGAKGQE